MANSFMLRDTRRLALRTMFSNAASSLTCVSRNMRKATRARKERQNLALTLTEAKAKAPRSKPPIQRFGALSALKREDVKM